MSSKILCVFDLIVTVFLASFEIRFQKLSISVWLLALSNCQTPQVHNNCSFPSPSFSKLGSSRHHSHISKSAHAAGRLLQLACPHATNSCLFLSPQLRKGRRLKVSRLGLLAVCSGSKMTFPSEVPGSVSVCILLRFHVF